LRAKTHSIAKFTTNSTEGGRCLKKRKRCGVRGGGGRRERNYLDMQRVEEFGSIGLSYLCGERERERERERMIDR